MSRTRVLWIVLAIAVDICNPSANISDCHAMQCVICLLCTVTERDCCRIIRAFLIEEQKIVKKVLKMKTGGRAAK